MFSIIDQTRPDQTAQHAQNSRKRKVLLTTFYSETGYGCVLQRCALGFILEAEGFEVHHLICQTLTSFRLKEIIRMILAFAGAKSYSPMRVGHEFSRRKTIRNFQNKYTGKKIFMPVKKIMNSSKEDWDDYDFAVTGSDQVWSGAKISPELKLAFYYLEFIERDKRIAYAPSFGFTKFDPKLYDVHKKGLLGFNRLSCREKIGCELIEQAIDAKAEHVLDPTLLINAEQWRKYSRKPECDLPEHYVLSYMLGDVSPEQRQLIKQFAGALPVIDMLDDKIIPSKSAGPAEFIYMIDHADFVFTNSFHGTAFTINLGKQFIVYNWAKINRMESLLSRLNISDHIYKNGMECKPDEINYDEVYSILNEWRKSSMKYLRECLKISN